MVKIYFLFLNKDLFIQFLFLSAMFACGLVNPKFFLIQKSSGLMNYFILNLTIKSIENPLENSKFFLKLILNGRLILFFYEVLCVFLTK